MAPRYGDKTLTTAAAGFLTAIAIASASAADPVTFEEAVARAQGRHEAIKAADQEIRRRDAEREAARGLRYPRVEMELRRYVLDDPVKVGVDPIPFSLEVQSDRFWNGQVEVTIPLYTGGRVDAANQAARARQDEARALLAATDQALLSELAERYFGLSLARQAREVQALKVQVMERHVARARRLLEEGVIARIEVLNAEVALSSARVELRDAEASVTIAHDALLNTIVSDGPVLPATSLFLVRDFESREAFVAFVNDQHPVMRRLAANEDLAKQGVRAEQGENRPTVYAFGMKELVPNDLTMLDPDWAVGVGLKYTLFDGFRGRHEVAAARATAQRVTHLRKQYDRDLKTLVVKRHEEMTTALGLFDAFEATLALTRENLRVRTRAFEEGQATSLEVIDATLSHSRARLGRSKAAHDFDVALFRLLEASGRSHAWREYLERAIPVEDAEIDADPDGPVNIQPDIGLAIPRESMAP
ncbi:MAG TPA: TolC family protein [Candidatus Hydrogenedentes bacterium]|nr:TolC family protein [Candidatus Hydrogenedentota bacterium]HNT87163.1 TolC family protein [Candidatus Hydrogenedentota bacterium]